MVVVQRCISRPGAGFTRAIPAPNGIRLETDLPDLVENGLQVPLPVTGLCTCGQCGLGETGRGGPAEELAEKLIPPFQAVSDRVRQSRASTSAALFPLVR